MIYYYCGSYEHGIWGIRIKEGWPYIKLKARWNEPLFSEREKCYYARIPLGFGWRIIIGY